MPAVRAIQDQPTQIVGTFVQSFLDAARIAVHPNANELERIPKTGGCLLVANRLFGPVDPVLVIKLVSEVRTDVAVVTSFDFDAHPELNDSVLRLDIDQSEEVILRQFQELLDQGKAVVVFPAKKGTITRLTASVAMDKRWHPKLLRVLFALRVPTLPIYLKTESIVSLIHSKKFAFDRMTAMFQDLKASEKRVTVRVGKPMTESIRDSFVQSENFSRYLRAKLYALGSPLKVNTFFPTLRSGGGRSLDLKPIATSDDPSIIEEELKALDADHRLIQQGGFNIYLAPAGMIPNTLQEIGKQRERTFRGVGEGTGLALDLDEYDMYYHQLILWDSVGKKIAGGYRIGFGHEIIEFYGKRGFYLHSLFRFKKPFGRILEQSIELGRSYVTPEYQRARLPLFLLWKGILTVLLQNLGYRYLIGPVSISNDYSSVSKELIVGFIRKYYWNEELAAHVRPRKRFRPSTRDVDVDILMEKLGSEMNELDKLIEELEPNNFKLPVLVKKYIKQEAKIIGFNVDPSFSDVLDGLIILDMMDIPIETLENLNRDLN